jgi:hypothetical protein
MVAAVALAPVMPIPEWSQPLASFARCCILIRFSNDPINVCTGSSCDAKRERVLSDGGVTAFTSTRDDPRPSLFSRRDYDLAADAWKAALRWLAEVPTAIEAGYPQLSFDGLQGFFGPRDVPPERRERIAADVRAAAAELTVADPPPSILPVIICYGGLWIGLTCSIFTRRLTTSDSARPRKTAFIFATIPSARARCWTVRLAAIR